MPTHASKKSICAALAFASLGGAAFAGPAQAKTWKASGTDPAGDAPAPGRDITEVKFRYKSNGSLLFVVTTQGPIDPAGADAVVVVELGESCKRIVALGGGVFSKPDPVRISAVKGKKVAKPREGKGEITGNVYTLSVKHSSFKGLKPGCLAVSLADPATIESDEPTVFDTTDPLTFK